MERSLITLVLTIFTLIISHHGDCANILVYMPFSAKSHFIVFNPIFKALAEKGHQITAYRAVPANNKATKNYNEILLPNYMEGLMKNSNFNVLEFGQIGKAGQVMALNEMALQLLEESYKSNEFKMLMKTTQKFDMVITEALFSQSSAVAFAHRFNAHSVVLMPLGNCQWTHFITSNPLSPSYIPDWVSVSTWDMDFVERILNTAYTAFVVLVNRFYYLPKFQMQVDRHFVYEGSSSRPPLSSLLSNISLVVENSHNVMNGATPKAPNLVTVGGININPNKPLPMNIKKWLDEAKNGCIYFSFGTVVQSDNLDNTVTESFVKAFSKIPQRVLWKSSEKVKVSSNVMLDSWMPQQDILAHPNTVLFISHGGGLSVSEAVHYGVPLVGTPFFGDQPKNIREVEKSGYGLKLDYHNITEQSILWAINEITNNKKYKETITKKSLIYRDRLNSPLDTAIYWIEHVLKHGGSHLRPHAVSMPWYQAESLDVAAVVLAAASLLLLITLLMLRKFFLFITCQTCRKKDKQTGKQKRS